MSTHIRFLPPPVVAEKGEGVIQDQWFIWTPAPPAPPRQGGGGGGLNADFEGGAGLGKGGKTGKCERFWMVFGRFGREISKLSVKGGGRG